MVVDNSVLGTISEKITKENIEIESYVDASSKAFIQENMEVEIIVSGLSQQKYGTLKGRIIYISSDSYINENNVLYKIKIKPEDIKLLDIDLSNGMNTELRIKYDSLTWFEWVLKKIGIIDR